ncbi:hypothetical protein GQ53DRAFT_406735 [Thozetella sp. PMI_491]|nr:hypothetical protein GQ53DRAFT_406735 [Thozetella sp. PMI_491]
MSSDGPMEEASVPVGSATAATRQKSCNACVKSKRACDKRYPACSRCAERNAACVYAKRPHAEAFPDEFDFDAAQVDPSWPDLGASPSMNLFSTSTPHSSSSLADVQFSGGLALLDLPFDLSLGAITNQAVAETMPLADSQLIHEPEGQPSRPQELDLVPDTFNYDNMADICIYFQPWQLYDPSSKAYYILQTLKSYPTVFAKDSYTPWMHKQLYSDNMPLSMRACFTTSSLYSGISDSNKASVFRVLFDIPGELKEQQNQHPASTPHEKLARTQALFLYQIIRLFDGDVTLRAQAEKDMSLLYSWLDDLCKIRENLGQINDVDGIGTIENPPKSWEWWIFSESVRRTILMAYAFIVVWQILSEREEAEFFSSWQYLHRWTLSRQLWEAPSSWDFFQSWKTTPRYVIGNLDFESFLKTGRGEDLDGYSKFLLVVYMGMDETKKWMADRGSVL